MRGIRGAEDRAARRDLRRWWPRWSADGGKGPGDTGLHATRGVGSADRPVTGASRGAGPGPPDRPDRAVHERADPQARLEQALRSEGRRRRVRVRAAAGPAPGGDGAE